MMHFVFEVKPSPTQTVLVKSVQVVYSLRTTIFKLNRK